jgi:hypothetical protein
MQRLLTNRQEEKLSWPLNWRLNGLRGPRLKDSWGWDWEEDSAVPPVPPLVPPPGLPLAR